MRSDKTHIIAIDGPSASGKSTVSREVAAAVHYNYLDTGSFYRGMTWKALEEGRSPEQTDQVLPLLESIDWVCRLDGHVIRFTIDGRDPGDVLRSEAVREHVSPIACIPEVRSFVNRLFRQMTQFGSMVVEGRDIGSVVFPEADIKIYLDASPEERARRRLQDAAEKDNPGDVDKVLTSLQRRDRIDSSRATAPLTIPDGAVVLDTTKMSREEVVQYIVDMIQDRGWA